LTIRKEAPLSVNDTTQKGTIELNLWDN
jgi:hypothetical protein